MAFSQYLKSINKYIILIINDTKITGQTVILIPGNKLMSLKNYTSNWCYQKRRRLSVPPILVSTQAQARDFLIDGRRSFIWEVRLGG